MKISVVLCVKSNIKLVRISLSSEILNVNNYITLCLLYPLLFCKNGGGVETFFEEKLRFLCLHSATREELNPKIV
jgi:uncharacterized membrane protein YhfC